MDEGEISKAKAPPFRQSLAELLKIKSFLILCLSASLSSFAGFAISLWIVDFLVRSHGMSIGEIFTPLALVMGIGGGIGTLTGGYVTDFFARKDKSAYFFVTATANMLSVPLYIAAIWAGTPLLCFGLFFFVFMLQNSVAGPVYGLVQNLAPIHLRAFAAALFFFLLSFLGFALGPFYIGVIADILGTTMGEADGLRWALTSLAPVWAISSIIMFFSLKTLRRELG